ncbi:phosphoethanolamine transferase domain-containing protein, partial [Salmonella enterica subsp. enterica serovar Cerro]|nr:phosphoethanolamine transferase domain-containing protein [Salmonella enterica subsp. enterica serovar Cerro]
MDTTPAETFALMTPQMVLTLGLSGVLAAVIAFWVKIRPATPRSDGQCLELRSADSQVRYSAENQRLTFIIPQAWMRYQDPDWVPP